jgi:AcrR family transcriptional regulator
VPTRRKAGASRMQKAAQTREALIAATIALVASDGLDVSLDAICARAGFTRGAFYVHFADRDDLLQTVMERVGRLFLEALFSGGTLTTTVRRFVEAVSGGSYPLTSPAGVKPHQLLAACARSEVVRARYLALIDQSLGQLKDQARRGQAVHEVRDDVSPEQLALLLMCVVVGAQTLLELKLPLDAPRLAQTLLKLLGMRRR